MSSRRGLARSSASPRPIEAWLRDHSTTLVTNIVEDQKVTVCAALEEDLARCDNPTRTALNVVGRVNRATGRREDGVIGLTAAQERYLVSAREELLSGEPDQLRRYLTRTRPDKRFDRTITVALRDGKPIPKEAVDRIVGRHSDVLLKLRADTIALNETFNSLAAAKEIAFGQQIAKGTLRADVVTKTWKHIPNITRRLFLGSTDPHQRLGLLQVDGFSSRSIKVRQRPRKSPGRWPSISRQI